MTTIQTLKKTFKNPELFEQALTHRSWLNENAKARQSNERLEFLGDAILEFVTSNELFKKLPDKKEGYLSALRANIVNTQNLAKVAQKLSVGEALYLSRGEEETGGRQNLSILADAVEAIIGALFLDQGIKATYKFITDNILYDLDKKLASPLKDPKSMLQEEVQARGLPTPKYNVVSESGPDHAKIFEVEVTVGSQILGRGSGKSKSEAEQSAAQAALEKDNFN